jgi:hypothetical protein
MEIFMVETAYQAGIYQPLMIILTRRKRGPLLEVVLFLDKGA